MGEIKDKVLTDGQDVVQQPLSQNDGAPQIEIPQYEGQQNKIESVDDMRLRMDGMVDRYRKERDEQLKRIENRKIVLSMTELGNVFGDLIKARVGAPVTARDVQARYDKLDEETQKIYDTYNARMESLDKMMEERMKEERGYLRQDNQRQQGVRDQEHLYGVKHAYDKQTAAEERDWKSGEAEKQRQFEAEQKRKDRDSQAEIHKADNESQEKRYEYYYGNGKNRNNVITIGDKRYDLIGGEGDLVYNTLISKMWGWGVLNDADLEMWNITDKAITPTQAKQLVDGAMSRLNDEQKKELDAYITGVIGKRPTTNANKSSSGGLY